MPTYCGDLTHVAVNNAFDTWHLAGCELSCALLLSRRCAAPAAASRKAGPLPDSSPLGPLQVPCAGKERERRDTRAREYLP